MNYRYLFGGLCWFLGELGLIVFLLLVFSERGYRKGYLRGRADSDAWWLGIESEVDRARLKIWREG